MIRKGINQEGYERDAHLLAMYVDEVDIDASEVREHITKLAHDYGTTYEIAREDVLSERTITDEERNTGIKPYPWCEI